MNHDRDRERMHVQGNAKATRRETKNIINR